MNVNNVYGDFANNSCSVKAASALDYTPAFTSKSFGD